MLVHERTVKSVSLYATAMVVKPNFFVLWSVSFMNQVQFRNSKIGSIPIQKIIRLLWRYFPIRCNEINIWQRLFDIIKVALIVLPGYFWLPCGYFEAWTNVGKKIDFNHFWNIKDKFRTCVTFFFLSDFEAGASLRDEWGKGRLDFFKFVKYPRSVFTGLGKMYNFALSLKI